MKVHLVLADDWELRGDGSGNMRSIQFDRIRQLTRIYERYGLRGTFNVEVMQQLYHLKFGCNHPPLLDLACEWEEVVKEIYSKNHDIQLHVHPQWHNAYYENGKWYLNKHWSILDYSPDDMRKMLFDCKHYLEELIHPLNLDYHCTSFRSGAWCIAPNEHILRILSELGIVFDMSIVNGLFYNFELAPLDYREVDESFLPFYPEMDDARRLSSKRQNIVCIPTHSFQSGVGMRLIHKVAATFCKSASPNLFRTIFLPPCVEQIKSKGSNQDLSQRQQFNKNNIVSNLSSLSYIKGRLSLHDIRKRARESGWPIVPAIFASHTKDIVNFAPIEKFCAYLANTKDIEVITSTELAKNLKSGVYPIKKRG